MVLELLLTAYSFVFPTAIATKAGAGGTGGSGSGRPAVANKPSFLTGGAGPSSQLSAKRGTEDLDFFIGDEALAASNGPGYGIHYPIRHGQIENWDQMERFCMHRLHVNINSEATMLM